MSEQRTLYDQIGGQPTISKIMNNLFDKRLPADTTTQPPVWDLFGHIRQTESTLSMHKKLVGSFIGSILGDSEPQYAITPDEMIEWHSDAGVKPEHFDVVSGHLIEAVREETGQHADEAIEAIGAVALELRAAVVYSK